MEEVLKTTYPPFRNVIFWAAANVYNDFVHIYTDGSKDPNTGKTGTGFYVEPLPPMKSFIGRARLNDNISVYSTELIAILHALIWIKSYSVENSNFVIFSDSLSALMAIGGSDSVRKDLINKIISIYKILIDTVVSKSFKTTHFLKRKISVLSTNRFKIISISYNKFIDIKHLKTSKFNKLIVISTKLARIS